MEMHWLFAGSLRASQRAAAVMRLLHSARLNGLDPWQYRKIVMQCLSTMLTGRIAELLPWDVQPLMTETRD